MAILVVIDTSVVASALRSSRGASYRLLQLLETGRVTAALSVPLFCEYEEVADRFVADGVLSERGKRLVLDYLCAHSRPVEVHFLWRPFLNDADDAMVLEAALASGARVIVTHNRRDFAKASELGISALTPGELLARLEEET